jgi:predicted nuclease with TOPRIM domain
MWREVFQEKVAVSRQGVFFLENFTVEIVYQYNPLWLSFRPTLWVWVLATFVCTIAVIVKRVKAPALVIVPTIAVRFSPEVVRSFVSSYEEKQKIILEMETLEAGVRKGRIPRRRYKVQKKTLETRLETLSRNLDDLKQKLRAAGGRYADLMRQLEVTEAEINEVEANIRSIEVRHRRGELSLEAYRKLLGDYERRKGNAETKISGILMRLREEMR